MALEFDLNVSSKMENLTAVSDFITSICAKLGLDDDQTFAVQMAVDEAVTNIIEHAYGGRPDGTIRLICRPLDEEVVVTIQDHGQPFEPEDVLPPDINAPLAQQEERCLGLYLMHRLMDSVEFQFDAEKGNVLTMRKKTRRGLEPPLAGEMKDGEPSLCEEC